MQAFQYFPAIVYRDEQPGLAAEVLPSCIKQLDQVRQEGHPIAQSAHLGCLQEFHGLSKYLLSLSVDALKSQGYEVEKYDFYLSGLWAQELTHGSGTNVHVHKNSQICGWLFLETPENGAYPIYHDTRLNKSMVELDFLQTNEIVNATNMIHFNNIVPGTVLFSNSWMQHQISGGSSSLPTRCVHFIASHKDR